MAVTEQDKRWADLRPETRKFVEDLRDEDIELLRRGLRLVQSFGTVATVLKWLIISLVGMFIATVTLAENVMKVLNWFRGIPR